MTETKLLKRKTLFWKTNTAQKKSVEVTIFLVPGNLLNSLA